MFFVAETPSGKGWKKPFRSPSADVLKFIAVAAAVTWLIGTGTARLGYNWQWYRIPRYLVSLDQGELVWGPLVEGLMVTLWISAVSLVLSMGIGLLVAIFRLSGSPVARLISRGYLEAVRNTPLLVQIFFIYFVLGPVFDIGRFASAVLALSLFEGAYASEIFRAGIVSIPKGQWEAALSSGLAPWDVYRCIILPQAIRRVLPPLTSQSVSLVKDSALVSTIAIYDLAMQAQALVSETFLTFEVWFTVAGMYLAITIALSSAVQVMEKRFRI